MKSVRRFETGGMRCLVIEDSRHDQEMIRRAMRGARVEADMTCVTTIAEARHVLSKGSIDMILVDNSLPDGRGSDFARELAALDEFRDIPIVIVSGWPSPFMWDKARDAGLAVIDKTDEPMLRLRDIFRRCVHRPVERKALPLSVGS